MCGCLEMICTLFDYLLLEAHFWRWSRGSNPRLLVGFPYLEVVSCLDTLALAWRRIALTSHILMADLAEHSLFYADFTHVEADLD